jgi:hypothetical protein
MLADSNPADQSRLRSAVWQVRNLIRFAETPATELHYPSLRNDPRTAVIPPARLIPPALALGQLNACLGS